MSRAGNCSVSWEVDRTPRESVENVVKSPFCYEMFTAPSDLLASRGSELKEDTVPLKPRRPPQALACGSCLSFVLRCHFWRKVATVFSGLLLNKRSGSPFRFLDVLHRLGAQVGHITPGCFEVFYSM